MKDIAILLYPDILMLDMAGPVEVFSIANRYLEPSQHYRISTISTAGPSVRASNGITLHADLLLSEASPSWDFLLVPGGPGAYNDRHDDALPWLQAAAKQSRRFGSICTGAFVLGEAGLLDHRHVTTHWHYISRLRQRFPSAQIETDKIFIKDDNLFTSGGVTAGIDMALSVVSEDHGRQIALDVAKVLLVVMQRQGGQAQFSPLVAAMAKEDSAIGRVQNYVLDHLEEPFSVDRLAGLAAMSPRHFARLFSRETSTTPMEFVQRARVDRARELLENSDLPLKTVAFRSGFGSARHMRLSFSERLGLTPDQYRRQFG
ncbi:GlxA family transcriptional regulator [Pseudomonas sp. RIT-PI-S]|uniref:GlxA family transcriptional regulator n=1 Tax=Pseudomonas sp. RIT-PI-S TaxID=3035295 RepID=UPI0021D88E09|nr:GlxA family transcriptional regulator [Pseudomonas sp. RIT-PI-S]